MKPTDSKLSEALIHLLRGVVYSENMPKVWQKILNQKAAIQDYLQVIGLELHIHEEDGYAWLAAHETTDSNLPRLIPRRQLSYPLSLLLVLLRKKYSELSTLNEDGRSILKFSDIIDLMQSFLPYKVNEVKFIEQVSSYLQQAIDMGFCKRLKSDEEDIEIKPIIKAFIDAQWLENFNTQFALYQTHAASQPFTAETESHNDSANQVPQSLNLEET